jgi:hypothetical protein
MTLPSKRDTRVDGVAGGDGVKDIVSMFCKVGDGACGVRAIIKR